MVTVHSKSQQYAVKRPKANTRVDWPLLANKKPLENFNLKLTAITITFFCVIINQLST